MKVTNNSNVRAYHVRNVMIAPGQSKEFTDDVSADIKGLDDLKASGAKAEDVEFAEEKSMSKADLIAALDEAGIEYPSNANKADLQALLDA